MKHGTIPYPRMFGPGDSGIDCKAVKRALAAYQHGAGGMGLRSLTFAQPAQRALSAFKSHHGLLSDPIYTDEAHIKLRPFFDEYGATLMARAALRIAAHKQRGAFVAAYRWSIAHNWLYHYAELRPIPEWLTPFQTQQTIWTDCSGDVEISARWAALGDPSGFGFNGQGNTSSLLAHCATVSAGQAQMGDLIVYRKGAWDDYGHHVVVVFERLPGGDFVVGSNGHQGDPGEYRHSAMAASQAASGYPVATFLRWLPPLT